MIFDTVREDAAMIVPNKLRKSCYPDSDGQPMADNALQFEWIVTLQGGCDALFADRPDVFVAGDHLIYPVEAKDDDDPESVIRFAPDVYVAFGRPKGYRGSYKVWEEDGIFPQVIFEVWSPGNRFKQMTAKQRAYEEYGAEEYYIIYPEFPAFVEGWVRQDGKFIPIPDISKWVSPRLGIRFEIRTGKLKVLRPDGTKFLTYVELDQQFKTAGHRAEAEAQRAEAEAQRANEEARRANEEARRAESAEERAARLAEKLRELGLDPDAA
jgi:Uma2 family endonuclease